MHSYKVSIQSLIFSVILNLYAALKCEGCECSALISKINTWAGQKEKEAIGHEKTYTLCSVLSNKKVNILCCVYCHILRINHTECVICQIVEKQAGAEPAQAQSKLWLS